MQAVAVRSLCYDETVNLRRINRLLLVLIILVDGYIIVAPLIPVVSFWWRDHDGSQRRQLTTQIHQDPQTQPIIHADSVVIPSMLLDQPILEGPVSQTYAILNKGIWRWPNGSTPDKGGNTTLIGHRFTYTQPKGALYYLNKVKIGDEIGVWWNIRLYLYKVRDIREVPPTATEIEAPTADSRLTIFTCTPLWLPHDRLVVVAGLEQS
jgi:LPXTG-site transpeptidase (sortase) family protein